MPRASDYLSSPRSVELRRTMVDRQLRTFDVTNVDVLEAVIATPREPFLNGELDSLVYSDATLEARSASTRRPLLAPMFVARALQLAEILPGETVLDVAGGPGYSAAIAARLAASVTALEDDEDVRRPRGAGFRGAWARRTRGAVRGDLPQAPPATSATTSFSSTAPSGSGRTHCWRALPTAAVFWPSRAGAGGSRGASRFMLYSRSGDSFGSRALFGAAAEIVLPAFAAPREFVF